jgi:hypothetical protein
MRASIIGSAVLALVASNGPAWSDALLPKDIQATFFNGQPFTASTPQKVRFKMIFTADHKATREPLGSVGGAGEGKWKLSNDGFCTSWKGPRFNCYRLITSGENKWSVMQGTTPLAFWSK